MEDKRESEENLCARKCMCLYLRDILCKDIPPKERNIVIAYSTELPWLIDAH